EIEAVCVPKVVVEQLVLGSQHSESAIKVQHWHKLTECHSRALFQFPTQRGHGRLRILILLLGQEPVLLALTLRFSLQLGLPTLRVSLQLGLPTLRVSLQLGLPTLRVSHHSLQLGLPTRRVSLQLGLPTRRFSQLTPQLI